MKSLVVYDSAFGNTQKVAEEIAKVLECKAVLVGNFRKSDLKGIELLVIGSPINGWQPLPTITNLLNTFESGELKDTRATTFDTRVKLFIHGDAKDKMAAVLKSAGAEIVAEPEAFYVKGTKGPLLEGELEKATAWAEEIKEKTKE